MGQRVKKWKERALDEKEVKCMSNGWMLSEGCLRDRREGQELSLHGCGVSSESQLYAVCLCLLVEIARASPLQLKKKVKNVATVGSPS